MKSFATPYLFATLAVLVAIFLAIFWTGDESEKRAQHLSPESAFDSKNNGHQPDHSIRTESPQQKVTGSFPARATRNSPVRLQAKEDFLVNTAEARDNEAPPQLKRKIDELHQEAQRRGIPEVTVDGARLSGFIGDQPVYTQDHNENAAISSGAANIRSTSSYNVTGDGVLIGQWETGVLRSDHVDLAGRVTGGAASSEGSTSHATHVAGTMIGNGDSSGGGSTLGMAPAGEITGYDYITPGVLHIEAKAIAATDEGLTGKIYLSNHSYGAISGWNFSGGTWSWYGNFSDDGDASNDEANLFGLYSSFSQQIDQLTVERPYLTMFYSMGNDQNDVAPSNGTTWYHNGSTAYTYDSSTHPGGDDEMMVDGSIGGFGTLTTNASAKNVISVGAVNDAVFSDTRNTAAATMTDFSSFGPTDDGRIKPDIVANGASLTSSSNSSTTATAVFSGTSMAAPNAAGTAALLTEYFSDRFPGESMRSSMLKALLIHTADDLGNAGPDYQFGWGLIDGEEAAEFIKETAGNSSNTRLLDGLVTSADTSDTFEFEYDGTGEIKVTLAWTDPEGSGTTSHNSRTSALVHDLNLVVTAPNGTTTHYPYVMPWVGDWSDGKLDDAATTGVNTVDNVEQVYIPAPSAGTYTISVDYAGSLTADQIYSLAITGGDFESEKPDGGGGFEREITGNYGTYTLVNAHDQFSTAHETSYGATSSNESVATVSVNGSGDVIITYVGYGSTYITLTGTNDMGDSGSVQFLVKSTNNVIFVDQSRNGAQNGNSWASAYNTLTDALAAASSGQEIWVADGTYYADVPSAMPNPGNQISSFQLVGGVAIYGGFSGNESAREERDPDTHVTILSGDLGGDDTQTNGITETAGDIVGNNTWLLIETNNSDDFVLDGFTLTGGKTDQSQSGDYRSAGLFIVDSCNNGIIRNCRFMGFDCEGAGAAIHNRGTGTLIEDCHFSGASSQGNGGAIISTEPITLTDCVFKSNTTAASGGAVKLAGSLNILRRCTFQGNTSGDDGGAISFSDGGTGVITNCLITAHCAK